jgi:tetratricopeptide (TPR) repeat protein
MSILSRIDILKSFAEEEPENPFNWYALALEYENFAPELAESYYHILLTQHNGYLPTYYKAAAFYAGIGQIERADEIYKNGIALAKEKQELKTLQELQNAYQNFLFELD